MASCDEYSTTTALARVLRVLILIAYLMLLYASPLAFAQPGDAPTAAPPAATAAPDGGSEPAVGAQPIPPAANQTPQSGRFRKSPLQPDNVLLPDVLRRQLMQPVSPATPTQNVQIQQPQTTQATPIQIQDPPQLQPAQQPQSRQPVIRSEHYWGSMQFLGPDTIADVVEAAEPSIVNITCNRPGYSRPRTEEEIRRHKRFYGDLPGENETYLKLSGTGVIVRSDGVILTSLHVVDGQSTITVTLNDRRTYLGRVLNRDSFYDLAVIRIDAQGLPVAKFADANQLRKGEWVIAIGNQMGLESTVTLGLISGIGREVKGYGAYGAKTGAVRFIQTDAPVNPGSSGGPLINLRGEVVGINTFVRDDAQNVGFAIPSNIAREVASKLTNGPTAHPYIGVEMVDPEQVVGAQPAGVQILTVKPNGPASFAGLLPGDVITQIDGRAVAKPDDVSRAVAGVGPGSILRLSIRRGESIKLINVRVEALPDDG